MECEDRCFDREDVTREREDRVMKADVAFTLTNEWSWLLCLM